MDIHTQVMNLLDDVEPTREQLSFQINTLQREVERLQMNFDSARSRNEELNLKINNVRGHIKDVYDMNGDLDEDLMEIARMLDISLTKQYAVEITVTYRGNVEIPISEDIDDLSDHISFEFSAPYSDEWEVDIYEDDIDFNYEEA